MCRICRRTNKRANKPPTHPPTHPTNQPTNQGSHGPTDEHLLRFVFLLIISRNRCLRPCHAMPCHAMPCHARLANDIVRRWKEAARAASAFEQPSKTEVLPVPGKGKTDFRGGGGCNSGTGSGNGNGKGVGQRSPAEEKQLKVERGFRCRDWNSLYQVCFRAARRCGSSYQVCSEPSIVRYPGSAVEQQLGVKVERESHCCSIGTRAIIFFQRGASLWWLHQVCLTRRNIMVDRSY